MSTPLSAGLGAVAEARGETERALRLFARTSALLEDAGLQLFLIDRERYSLSLAAVRALVDDARFRILWEDGLSLRVEQAIVYALEETA